MRTRALFLVPAMAVALALTACGSSSLSDAAKSIAPTSAESSSPADPGAESPSPEESSPAAPAAPKPITYKGNGNKVLKIAKPSEGAVLITTTIKGPSDNNVVYSLDDALETDQLLVNTIGSYRGTTILDKDDEATKRLKIEVSGNWVITLAPLSSARVVATKASGSKDDVLVYQGDSPAIMNFNSTSGDSNVTAYWYSDSGTDLLVNDIGKFKTEAPMSAGPGYIEVSSDGAWNLTIQPV